MDAYVFTHHSSECPHKDNRFYRKCKCRKWLYIEGARKRISAKTRSWEAAELKAKQISGTGSAEVPTGKTIEQAVRSFLEDKDQQALSKNWLSKLKRELNDLASYCNSKVVLLLSDVRLQTLEDYRKTWRGEPITRRKRQERLKQFFIYCQRHKWVLDNPASSLSTIKVSQRRRCL